MKTILYLFPLVLVSYSLIQGYLTLMAYKNLKILGLTSTIDITKSEKDAVHLTQIAQYRYQQKSSQVLVIVSISLTLLYCVALLTKVSIINDIDLTQLEKLIGVIGGVSISGTSLYFWHKATNYYDDSIHSWNDRIN